MHHGYVFVYAPEHPAAQKDGYIREHHLVWTRKHGPLKRGELVHHKNDIKTDNRLSNLQAMTFAAHRAHHASKQPLSREHLRAVGKKGADARWGKK